MVVTQQQQLAEFHKTCDNYRARSAAFQKALEADGYTQTVNPKPGAPWVYTKATTPVKTPPAPSRPTQRRASLAHMLIAGTVAVVVLTMLALFIAQMMTNPL